MKNIRRFGVVPDAGFFVTNGEDIREAVMTGRGMRMKRMVNIPMILAFLLLICGFGAPSLSWSGNNHWTSLGPDGGQVEALTIDPSNSQILYAGTWGGGVFTSTNRGESWSIMISGLLGGPVDTINIGR